MSNMTATCSKGDQKGFLKVKNASFLFAFALPRYILIMQKGHATQSDICEICWTFLFVIEIYQHFMTFLTFHLTHHKQFEQSKAMAAMSLYQCASEIVMQKELYFAAAIFQSCSQLWSHSV